MLLGECGGGGGGQFGDRERVFWGPQKGREKQGEDQAWVGLESAESSSSSVSSPPF